MANKGKANNSIQWTIMVYLVGDNNLSEEMIYAIKEMYRVGTIDNFDVVIKFDPSAIGPTTQRYVITREEIARFKEKNIDIFEDDLKDKVKALAAATGASYKASAVPHKVFQTFQKSFQRRKPEDFGLDRDGSLTDLNADKNRNTPTRSSGQRSLNIQKPLPRPNSENSANPEVLKEFIVGSMTKHPSKHYMLVLSGHGSGVAGDFLPDDNPGTLQLPSSLSIPGLGKVLRVALADVRNSGILGADEKIDILGMDSCLMSMAEVGFEVENSVEYLVGSEGFELNTGWPYHRILEEMNRKLAPKGGKVPVLTANQLVETIVEQSNKGRPYREILEDAYQKALPTGGSVDDLKAEQLAKIIVEKYIDYYTDYQLAGASTDLSACDLKEIRVLAQKVGSLAEALCKGLNDPLIKGAIVLAHWDAQSYKSDQYVDLWDFCARLQLYLEDVIHALQKLDGSEALQNLPQLKKLNEIIEICERVKKAIYSPGAHVVLKSCYSGTAFQHSHGISVYLPWAESDFLRIKPKEESESLSKYVNLKFATAKEGQAWATFLREYLRVTRRDRRDQNQHLKNGKPDDEKLLHFDAPNETVLFVRHTSTNAAKTTDSETGSMKNPPDGFYPDKCIDR